MSILILMLLPFAAFAQVDTTEVPSPFDEPFFFTTSDQSLKIKGYTQLDFYNPFNDTVPSEFVVNRARLALTGYFDKKFRYMLYMRMDNGEVELNEAFLEMRHLSYAKFRIGQFKVPFSLSNLRSSSQLDLIERPIIIDNFSPAYDVGAMIFGDFLQNKLFYAFAIMNGTSRNGRERNNGKDIIGRISLQPLEDIMVGSSYGNGRWQQPFEERSISTAEGINFLNVDTTASLDLERYGFDFWLLKKSYSIKAEYLKFKASNLFTAKGGYLTLTYILSGAEKVKGENVVPESSFSPSEGEWGAFEYVIRGEIFESSQKANIMAGFSKARGLSTGINWYLNEQVKLLLNYQYLWLKENSNEYIDNDIYKSIMFRVQYQF